MDNKEPRFLFAEDLPTTKEEIEVESRKKIDTEAEKENQDTEKGLSEAIVAALGEDPLESKALPVNIHSSLIKRYAYISTNGFLKEDKVALISKYAIPETLAAPFLNEQIQSKLKERALKRDGYRCEDQKLVASALTALGTALTMINSQDEEGLDQEEFIEKMADAARLTAWNLLWRFLQMLQTWAGELQTAVQKFVVSGLK